MKKSSWGIQRYERTVYNFARFLNEISSLVEVFLFDVKLLHLDGVNLHAGKQSPLCKYRQWFDFVGLTLSTDSFNSLSALSAARISFAITEENPIENEHRLEMKIFMQLRKDRTSS